MVTHYTTSRPIRSLSTRERTGSAIFCDLRPYVTVPLSKLNIFAVLQLLLDNLDASLSEAVTTRRASRNQTPSEIYCAEMLPGDPGKGLSFEAQGQTRWEPVTVSFVYLSH